MTRTRRFLFGVGWGYLNQIILAAAGIYLTRFYLDQLTSPIYGLWIVGLQLVTYLSLLDLGLIALLPREVALASGKDRATVAPLVGETFTLTLYQWPILFLGSAAVWWALPDAWLGLRGPMAFVLAAYCLLFPLRLPGATLQGLQDFHFLGWAQLFCWAVGVVASVLGVKGGIGLYALGVGWTAQQGLQSLLCLWRLRRQYPEMLPRGVPRASFARFRERLSSSLWITVSQISGVLLIGTDVLVLGKWMGPTVVVLYSCTGKLIQLLVNQPQMITQAAMPGLAELRSSKNQAGILRVTDALLLLVMGLSGAIFVCLLPTNGAFVRWWVGPPQYGGDALTLTLLTVMVLRHLETAVTFALFCFGREKALALIGLLDGLVTLGLSITLTFRLGPLGPVVGSLGGVLLVGLPGTLLLLGQDLQKNLTELLAPLKSWSIRFGALAAVALAVTLGYPPHGLGGVVAYGAGFALAYAVLMLPLSRHPALSVYLEPLRDRMPPALRRAL